MNSVDSMRDNNFDLLRVLFSVIVFLVHAYVLSGSEELSFLEDWLSSQIAVQSFFIVSGFLIFMSYEKSRNIRDYFLKRVRRVYPAYFAIIILCALLGGFISKYSPEGYYFSLDWFQYILANLLFLNFLHPNLPGVFSDNAISAVNGALWTLKIEVMFYCLVPIFIWMMNKWGRLKVLLLLYIASHIYVFVVGIFGNQSGLDIYAVLQRQLPGQLSFFIAGALLYYYFEQFKRYYVLLLGVALLIVLMKTDLPNFWLEEIALAVTVVYLAYIFPFLGKFGKYGDFSYGIYILHFPILQTLIMLGLFDLHPYIGLAVAAGLIFLCSFLFWHLIEKVFLRRHSHYVEVSIN